MGIGFWDGTRIWDGNWVWEWDRHVYNMLVTIKKIKHILYMYKYIYIQGVQKILARLNIKKLAAYASQYDCKRTTAGLLYNMNIL